MPGVTLSDAVYRRLLLLRSGLRHFERWSEQQAARGRTDASAAPIAAGHLAATTTPVDRPLARWRITSCCVTTVWSASSTEPMNQAW